MTNFKKPTVKRGGHTNPWFQNPHKIEFEIESSPSIQNPHKIEFEIGSSPSKCAGRKYPQNKWEDHTPARGQEFNTSVPKGEITARVSKEDKNDTERPIPKIRKINDTNYKIDSIRTVEGHTQYRPRWKEGRNIDRIDSNKNTPDLRTLVTTYKRWIVELDQNFTWNLL